MESYDQVFRQTRDTIGKGSTIEEIELSRLPDDQFAGELLYTQDCDYIDWRVKHCHDIRTIAELVWQ